MSDSWTDVSDTTLSAGKPLKQSLWREMRDNDKANAVKPLRLDIDESNGSVGTSYGSSEGTYYVYVPNDAVVLNIPVALWTASGTATAKATIQLTSGASGSADSNEPTSTATAKGSPSGSADVTLTFSDLTSVSGDDLRGQEAKVDIFLKHSAGGVQVDIESTDWTPAHFAAE